ncbi:MAG: DUF4926 domain-containing protein [Anaerolineae bacterium]|nr:DUF4926 domain-containing protein [Anaerolineae bacterium]
MKPELYTEVALTHDFPEYRLRQGDLAMLVDYVQHPTGGEEGAILEVFNAVGESIAVVTVPASAIELPRADQIRSVRGLETPSK